MQANSCSVRWDRKRHQLHFWWDEHSQSCMEHFLTRKDVDIYSFYEGHTMDLVTFATRVCKVLGVETMIGELYRMLTWTTINLILCIVTNAAGGLNQKYRVGDIVCLNDVSDPVQPGGLK
jgi:purine nucleoside phosphorylase